MEFYVRKINIGKLLEVAFYLHNGRQHVFVLTLTLYLVASITLSTQSKHCIFQLWREINVYVAVVDSQVTLFASQGFFRYFGLS